MRSRLLSSSRSYAVICLFATLIGCSECGADRSRFIYRLHPEARGWVILVLDQPGAPPLLRSDDGAFVVEVPESGVVVTSTKPQVGKANDEFWIRNPDTSHSPLSRNELHAEHAGWRRKDRMKPIVYDIFFVGSEEELKVAEPEEQFVARVYEALSVR